MNFELKICRICLKNDLKDFRIFSSDDEEVSQIYLISSIKIEDEKVLICLKCRKRLKDANKLRNDCIKAAKYFQSLNGNSPREILENVEILPKKKKKKFQCQKCVKIFSCIYYLKQHELAVHTQVPQDELFECDQCEIKLKTKALMRAHQLNYHCNLEEKASASYQCKFCGRISKSIGALIAHEKTHKEVPLESYQQCQFCSKTFKEKRHLKSHIELVHEKSRAKQCNQCGFIATCSGSLNKHVKAVHLKLRNHFCSECNQGFCTNQQLKRHERSHRGEKPFKCENCEKFFADPHGLKRHQKNCSSIK